MTLLTSLFASKSDEGSLRQGLRTFHIHATRVIEHRFSAKRCSDLYGELCCCGALSTRYSERLTSIASPLDQRESANTPNRMRGRKHQQILPSTPPPPSPPSSSPSACWPAPPLNRSGIQHTPQEISSVGSVGINGDLVSGLSPARRSSWLPCSSSVLTSQLGLMAPASNPPQTHLLTHHRLLCPLHIPVNQIERGMCHAQRQGPSVGEIRERLIHPLHQCSLWEQSKGDGWSHAFGECVFTPHRFGETAPYQQINTNYQLTSSTIS